MSHKKLLRSIAISAIIFLIVTEAQIISLAVANPTWLHISVISPEQNKTYNRSTIPLVFTFPAGEVSWMGYSLDNQDIITVSGNDTLSGLSNGSHSLTVYANDTFGFMEHSNKISFAVDVGATPISIISPENKTYNTSTVPLIFKFPETEVSWMGYSLDNQDVITVSGNSTYGQGNQTITASGDYTLSRLADGSHSIIVYTNDTSGWTQKSQIVIFTVDATPPIIKVSSPENTTYNTTTNFLNFTVNKQISWMGYSLDNQANTTISGNITLAELSEGKHSITVFANDTVGNTGTETVNFTVSTLRAGFLGTGFPMEYGFGIVASLVVVAVVGVGMVYFKKRKRKV